MFERLLSLKVVPASGGRFTGGLIVPPCPPNPWYGSAHGAPIFKSESPVRPTRHVQPNQEGDAHQRCVRGDCLRFTFAGLARVRTPTVRIRCFGSSNSWRSTSNPTSWILHGARFVHLCGTVGCFSSLAAMRLWWRRSSIRGGQSLTSSIVRAVSSALAADTRLQAWDVKTQLLEVTGCKDSLSRGNAIRASYNVLHDNHVGAIGAACVAEVLRCFSL